MAALAAVVLLYQIASVLSQTECSLTNVTTGEQQCTVVDMCAGLRCPIQPPFEEYIGFYSTMKCVDPVQVMLSIEPITGQPFYGQFAQSEIVPFGGDTFVNVSMGRNATHLDFQTTIYHSQGQPVTVFPEAFVPLDPAECMCSSLESLATKAETIHPAIESNCQTIPITTDSGTVDCGGVKCTLTVAVIFTYNVMFIPLPCNDSVTFIVTNAFNQPVVTEMFQGSTDETRPVTIDIFSLNIRQIIQVNDYSMDVQTFLSENSIGTLEIVPQHRIILDKTQCSVPLFPPVVMSTIAPPPSPPPLGAPHNCYRWYNIALEVRTAIFACDLKSSCETGLDCILVIAQSAYRVGVSLVNDRVSLSVTSEDRQTVYQLVEGRVELPMPSGSLLLPRQRVDTEIGYVGFQLDLNVTVLSSSVEAQRTDTLIPYSAFLTQSDPCPSLDGVLRFTPQCRAIGCSGLTCQPSAPFDDFTASYLVTNCADPVYVDLTLVPNSLDGQAFTARVVQSNSSTVYFSGNSGISISMPRNATHLDFQATIFSPNTSSTLFPESFHPLEPAACMCSSLNTLATKAQTIHPTIESNCGTARDCTSVRCQLNIAVVFVYYIEMVVLPCNNSLEFLIEDLLGLPLIAERFQGPGSETRVVSLLGFEFRVEMYIQVQDYSMTVQTFLTDQTLGRLEIIPQQTIILDRTHCDIPEFSTVAMPTRAPPPQPITSDASPICTTLSDLTQNIYINSPIFRCDLKEQCEAGLSCVLDIAHTQYRVDITVEQSSVEFSVSSLDGGSSYGVSKNRNTTVALPTPDGSSLVFRQNTGSQRAVGFGLQLQVSFLNSAPQTEELIPYTVVTWPQPARDNTALIAVLVVIFLLLAAALIVGVVIVGVCCYLKRSNLGREPFNFQRMSDLKEKELENYVKTDISNPLPGVGVPPGLGGGASKEEQEKEEEDVAKIDLTLDDD